jgi:acyl-CoA thioesterase-1
LSKKELFWTAVSRHQPDLVLVAFGLNDSLGGPAGLAAFGEALAEIAGRIRSRTEADLVFLTPPFMAEGFSERIHPEHRDFAEKIIRTQKDGTLAAYAEKIREVARANDLPVADIHAGWARLAASGVDTDLWLVNGLNHPDARGHRFAATTVLHLLLSRYPSESPH